MTIRPEIRSTTVLAVIRGGAIAMASDGQVTVGETMMKRGAHKVRRSDKGDALIGFAGGAADALALTDYARFEQRRAQAAARGRLRGYGLSVYQEPDGYYDSHVRAAFDADGVLSVFTTAQANGQGHVTTFTQMASEQLGLPAERIRIVQGDSDRSGVATGIRASPRTRPSAPPTACSWLGWPTSASGNGFVRSWVSTPW